MIIWHGSTGVLGVDHHQYIVKYNSSWNGDASFFPFNYDPFWQDIVCMEFA